VPAGRSSRPRPARAGAVRPVAQGRLGVLAGLVKKSMLTRGPQASAIEGGKVAALISWAGRAHELGRLDQVGRGIRPGSRFGVLEIKRIS
jgi:hypothetical protein